MPKKNLLILGAGGFGQSIAEVAALSAQWQQIYFVDDRWPEQKQVGQYSIISNIQNLSQLQQENVEAIVAVGNNQIRQKWQQLLLDLSIPLATIIHPQAVISPSAQIGQGVSIMAGCIIGTNTIIQDGVLLNIGTLLDHDVVIEHFSHLSVGVNIAGGQRIPSGSFLEVGTRIGHKS
ncbi:acetyltransferase [Acinetobacter variabilis]|mgnify:FL=1|uniref:acetyltransferase n=1 Tax=Acinetobacter TaxID=469 RepID=UPI0012E15208|nr:MULTISPECIES: acetyltransferase [Acinetobacter]MCU4311789.1 acetyltransferase [Acinetobacter variabilis]MDM1272916.1 acetyltransferase [Acinetobacter indicus]MDM1278674.1 acetyltransferase [Acinetobacter indicus]MDM1301961.1 acetyltransferase [Acinetobacter indicus]MDM1311772.1 acetyltransferase [Acinetobacter indicus]